MGQLLVRVKPGLIEALSRLLNPSYNLGIYVRQENLFVGAALVWVFASEAISEALA